LRKALLEAQEEDRPLFLRSIAKPAALVHCLLDTEGDYTPDGYKLIASAHAGDYELKLWQGLGHVQGKTQKFIELSLNRVGLQFDPDSQKQTFKGGIHALGQRHDLLRTVARWLKQYGTIFVGSHNLEKLTFYHRLLKRYLFRLQISDPYPAFDESEGVSDYFRIEPPEGVNALESLIESLEDPLDGIDPQRYIDDLPSVLHQMKAECRVVFDRCMAEGEVTIENRYEVAESIVIEIVNNYFKPHEHELPDWGDLESRAFSELMTDLVLHADQRF